MNLYGTNTDYTLGWDDCEDSVVIPLQEEITILKNLNKLLTDKLSALKNTEEK